MLDTSVNGWFVDRDTFDRKAEVSGVNRNELQCQADLQRKTEIEMDNRSIGLS